MRRAVGETRRRTMKTGKARRHRKSDAAAVRLAEQGRMAGAASGWDQGYRFGRCQAIINNNPQPDQILFDKKVLYVTSGLSVPYAPLDAAIIESLSRLVREINVVTPNDDMTEQARHMRPDLVLTLEGIHNFKAEKIKLLREMGIKTAIWLSDDPYYTDITIGIVPHYDYVFTLELQCVALYKQLGCKNVYYLPFAVNPKVFTPQHVGPAYKTDICFIGTAFWNRVAFFDQLSDYLQTKKYRFIGLWWDRLKQYNQMSSRIRLNTWLSPEETVQYYNGAKIVINLHRAFDDQTFNQNSRKIHALSLNPRTFEIAGCGTLQLSDMRSDLQNFYEPGKEIVTYSSPSDLVKKMEYYLNHEEDRRNIAFAALERTLREHTYRRRLYQLLTLVFQ
ncbi:CgeB family protein [Paenibacillus sp. y28]|uniref:CgeB family protein n=1 Tax=Paenibacillus sp. y28 TaxID=3129110 RepID=UPI0030158B0F